MLIIAQIVLIVLWYTVPAVAVAPVALVFLPLIIIGAYVLVIAAGVVYGVWTAYR